MAVCFPKPLVPGDKIAVTAPSAGVRPTLHRRLDLAIDALRQRGYDVVEGTCLREQSKEVSAPGKQRAAELMQFLTDPTVAAVMPPWGGELAIELIERLDFDALRSVPAKWFSGFSDISTLLLPVTLCSGWATVHGPSLMDLAARDLDPTTAAIWQILTLAPGQTLEQRSSVAYERTSADWVNDPAAGLRLSEPTQWQRLKGSDETLTLQGRLIGGCLDAVSRLAGTRYGDIPAFADRAKGDGVILYLENAELTPCELARALQSLRLNQWFDGMAGILIGRSAAPDAPSADGFSYLDALHSALGDSPCPVLFDLDIGHRPPQITLVNGAMAQVTFEAGCGTVVQQMG